MIIFFKENPLFSYSSDFDINDPEALLHHIFRNNTEAIERAIAANPNFDRSIIFNTVNSERCALVEHLSSGDQPIPIILAISSAKMLELLIGENEEIKKLVFRNENISANHISLSYILTIIAKNSNSFSRIFIDYPNDYSTALIADSANYFPEQNNLMHSLFNLRGSMTAQLFSNPRDEAITAAIEHVDKVINQIHSRFPQLISQKNQKGQTAFARAFNVEKERREAQILKGNDIGSFNFYLASINAIILRPESLYEDKTISQEDKINFLEEIFKHQNSKTTILQKFFTTPDAVITAANHNLDDLAKKLFEEATIADPKLKTKMLKILRQAVNENNEERVYPILQFYPDILREKMQESGKSNQTIGEFINKNRPNLAESEKIRDFLPEEPEETDFLTLLAKMKKDRKFVDGLKAAAAQRLQEKVPQQDQTQH